MTIHLRAISINDRDLIQKYLHRFPPEISELTFSNLFVWRHYRPIWLTEVMDSLVILADSPDKGDKKIIFGQPLGETPLLALRDALGPEVIGASRLVAEYTAPLQKVGISIHSDRDNSDYVYQVSDLAQLSGRRFSKKRNHVKQCLKKNHCEYVELTPDLIPACLNMQDQWCKSRQCGKNRSLCNENLAIQDVFDNYETFNLIGGAIRVNGEIQAFAIGEKLNLTTAVWHFEKAFPTINGLSQLINNWFAKYALKDFEFVNREQDLGIAGLRQAKESYYPHHMVDKFNVSFTPTEYTEVNAETCL